MKNTFLIFSIISVSVLLTACTHSPSPSDMATPTHVNTPSPASDKVSNYPSSDSGVVSMSGQITPFTEPTMIRESGRP